MLGLKHIEIGPDDFVRGLSTADNLSDGGFSPLTEALNITAVKGVLYAPASSVDSDTDARLTGNLIASCPDMTFTSPSNRLCVSDDGKFYRYNGTKLDAAGVALTASKTWTKGFTDIITFGGEAYVSSKESLTRVQNDNTIDAGASWPFNFTTSNVPHPGLVYENNMYWGDKNLLLMQSAIGDATAPTTVLTLSSDQMIVALGIDPATGLMLISTKNTLDISGTIPTINKLLWYDGNSAKVSKSAIVEAGILGFCSVGGAVLVGYGHNIGYLSGSGIQFLRKLANVSLNNEQLPYKHNMAAINNTFYVLDGVQVLAFGEVLNGSKVWYPAWYNPVNSNKPTMLAEVGSGKLGMAFATTKFYTFDATSVATSGALDFRTNRYLFPRPVHLRGVYVEYLDAIVNNDDNRFLYIKTENEGDDFVLLQDRTATVSAIKNTTGASAYFFEIPFSPISPKKVRMVQLRYEASTTNYGLRRIIVYYDPAE